MGMSLPGGKPLGYSGHFTRSMPALRVHALGCASPPPPLHTPNTHTHQPTQPNTHVHARGPHLSGHPPPCLQVTAEMAERAAREANLRRVGRGGLNEQQGPGGGGRQGLAASALLG